MRSTPRASGANCWLGQHGQSTIEHTYDLVTYPTCGRVRWDHRMRRARALAIESAEVHAAELEAAEVLPLN